MVINSVTTYINVVARKGYKMLEPYDGKPSRTVLIGERGSNPSDLLDSVYGRSLVKYLVKNKQLVKHVNANLVASERNSGNVLEKTDSIDGECVARILISRFDKLPKANPSDDYWVLNNLVTHRNSVVKTNIKLKRQLHDLLPDHYPSYKKFFFETDGMTALAFFEAYSSPCLLEGISIEELAEFLNCAAKGTIGANKSKAKATMILKLIAEDGVETCSHQEIRNFIIQSTIQQIQVNNQALNGIDKQLEELIKVFGYHLMSMQGISVVIAAKLIAEIGDIERFQTSASLARYAGVAPVTYESGMSSVQYANKRGNRRLNEVLYNLAFLLIVTNNGYARNPFFYRYYRRKIGEGKTKKQAFKCLQRRLVNVIWGMMKYKKPYENPPRERVELLENDVVK